MNYEEALEYIHQLNEKGVSLGLERIWQLLELLGHPEQSLRCIHVAGTNGKGSGVRLFGQCAAAGRIAGGTLYFADAV